MKSTEPYFELLLGCIDVLLTEYDSLFIKDLIWLVTLLIENQDIPQAEKVSDLLPFLAQRTIPLFKTIEISRLCEIVNLFGKHDFGSLSAYVNRVNLTIEERINEVSKKDFANLLGNLVDQNQWRLVKIMFSILEELSEYKDIKDTFGSPEDACNLLWSLRTSEHNGLGTSERLEQAISGMSAKMYDIDVENISSARMAIRLVQARLVGLDKSKLSTEAIHEVKTKFTNLLLPEFKNSLVSQDAFGKIDEKTKEDVDFKLTEFFKLKINAVVARDVVDDMLNLINFCITFEVPQLETDEVVGGIDRKIFSVLLTGNLCRQDGKMLNIYRNRIHLLKDLGWEVIEIDVDEWNKLQEEKKSELLILLFGTDLRLEENCKIVIEKKKVKMIGDEGPKFNLTKEVMKKKK